MDEDIGGDGCSDVGMSDIEALRDLVVQHVAHAVHPLTEHLYQLDMTVNFTQQAVRALNGDVTEVKGGLKTTNRCLELLREELLLGHKELPEKVLKAAWLALDNDGSGRLRSVAVF